MAGALKPSVTARSSASAAWEGRACGIMRAILLWPRRRAETTEELGGKLEPCALRGQRPRDAQPLRPVEPVLARAALDEPHHGCRVDLGARLEQHRASLGTQVEAAHAERTR